MAAHNELGKWGEEVAVAFLQRQGYTIVERDWKSGHRDIDIIAQADDGTIVFVEVKTRRNSIFGEPEDAVDHRKLHHLQGAINHYIKCHYIDQDVRIDIVTVVGTPGEEPEINHITDIK